MKECPFCNSDAIIREKYRWSDLTMKYNYMYSVQCRDRNDTCLINGRTHWYNTKEEAEDAWNKRKEDK